MPKTQHESLILESDRNLMEAVKYLVARTPVSAWPVELRLPLKQALSEVVSENRVSAYRADALHRYLMRTGLLENNECAESVRPGAPNPQDDDAILEYTKDRFLADLLPAVAREVARGRCA